MLQEISSYRTQSRRREHFEDEGTNSNAISAALAVVSTLREQLHELSNSVAGFRCLWAFPWTAHPCGCGDPRPHRHHLRATVIQCAVAEGVRSTNLLKTVVRGEDLIPFIRAPKCNKGDVVERRLHPSDRKPPLLFSAHSFLQVTAKKLRP